jgi:ABC-type dipeptide/oligopeptide/nickel transport system permease subunit
VGGPLRSSLKVSTGGESGLDDDLRIVDYVESTPGFLRAVPVLKHVFSEGLSVSSFQVRRPGESLSRALVRLGWFDLARIAEGRIAQRILDEFVEALEVRLSKQPFRFCALI